MSNDLHSCHIEGLLRNRRYDLDSVDEGLDCVVDRSLVDEVMRGIKVLDSSDVIASG